MALYFALSNAFIGRPSHFVGLRNFVNLWQSDAFRQTFQNAFVFTGTAVAGKLVMGIALALLLNQQLWFKRMIRGAVLLPWVIPTALSHARLVVDVQLALQRGELDGHRARSHGPAGTELARPEILRHGRGDHRQYLARPAVLRDHASSRAWSRSRRSSTRRPRPTAPDQRPLLARHPAAAQAGSGRRRALLDHLHLQRLQHRLRPDARRSHQLHAPLRHAVPRAGASIPDASAKVRPSRSTSSRSSPSWSGRSSASCGTESTDGEREAAAAAEDRCRTWC